MPQKNPYGFDRSFLPNPCDALYQDAEISKLPHIQELVELAQGMEDQLSGDFDLDFLLFQIADNSLAFVKSGLIFFKIKALRLYSGVCGTFKQFCAQKLGYSTWYVNRIIHYLTYKINNKQQQQWFIFFTLSKVTVTEKN